MSRICKEQTAVLAGALKAVCSEFKTDWRDVLQKKNGARLRPARVALAKRLRGESWKYGDIGAAMDGRAASTIHNMIYGYSLRPKRAKLDRSKSVKTQASWIIDFIAEYHGKTPEGLIEAKYARDDAIGHAVLVMRMQGLSFPQIGRALNRCHSTAHRHYSRLTRKVED